jgi:cytochrome c-type biogenesis protein CcmH
MGRANDAHVARDGGASRETGATTASKPTSGQSERATDAAQICRIFGTVQIAAELAAVAMPGTTLLVYAMDAVAPGPPLAVLRLRVDRWPMSFILDDADAMIPGRNLSCSRSIQLEARVSPSGEALPRPGDLIGILRDVDPHTAQAVNISIDAKVSA